jgi:hypothetical protein
MTTATIRKLTAHDRCDRCGASGKVLVVTPAGELVFCGHHASEHSEAMIDKGYRFTSERDGD